MGRRGTFYPYYKGLELTDIFVLFISDNSLESKAMLEIQSGLTEIDDSKIYSYLTKFDIAYKNSEIEIMKKALDEIEDLVQSHDYFLNALKIRKARYYSSLGEKTTALNNLKKINNMPPKTIESLKTKSIVFLIMANNTCSPLIKSRRSPCGFFCFNR